jgi:hypothetical protein
MGRNWPAWQDDARRNVSSIVGLGQNPRDEPLVSEPSFQQISVPVDTASIEWHGVKP